MTGNRTAHIEALLVVASLWAPAMIGSSHEWIHGSYYGYGWVIPPVAAWLAWRRWNEGDIAWTPLRRSVILAACVILLPWFTVLRVLGLVDPSWRLPLGLSAATAVFASHFYLMATRGRAASRDFIWITLLLLSAIPLPTVIEENLVSAFTKGVITSTLEVFHLVGRPVEASGGLLSLNGGMVEVSDGCSGIRSFQSFLMATWLFAELQDLDLYRAIRLFVFAVGTAFVVNIARAAALAQITFSGGKQAFDHAHDALGLLAFLISAALFYGVSARLGAGTGRRLLRVHAKGGNA